MEKKYTFEIGCYEVEATSIMKVGKFEVVRYAINNKVLYNFYDPVEDSLILSNYKHFIGFEDYVIAKDITDYRNPKFIFVDALFYYKNNYNGGWDILDLRGDAVELLFDGSCKCSKKPEFIGSRNEGDYDTVYYEVGDDNGMLILKAVRFNNDIAWEVIC